MVLRKDQLEVQLKDEHQLIRDGVLRDESPLDDSPEFHEFCHACRIGNLKSCHEAIASGVNINARDKFDYTPLILVSIFTVFSYLLCPSNKTDFSRLACVGTMRLFSFCSSLAHSASETLFRASGVSITH
jgi:hypothetical protein